MKVNGWGYGPRGDVWQTICPGCEATLDFGEDEAVVVRIGRVKICTLRCARCDRRINIGHHPSHRLDAHLTTLD